MLLSNSKPKLVAYGNVTPRGSKKKAKQTCVQNRKKNLFMTEKPLTSLEARIAEEMISPFPPKFKIDLTKIIFNKKFQIHCCGCILYYIPMQHINSRVD